MLPDGSASMSGLNAAASEEKGKREDPLRQEPPLRGRPRLDPELQGGFGSRRDAVMDGRESAE